MSSIESSMTPSANQLWMAVVIDVVRRQSNNMILGLYFQTTNKEISLHNKKNCYFVLMKDLTLTLHRRLRL